MNIHDIVDKDDMKFMLRNLPYQILNGFDIGKDIFITSNINNIVVSGIGGSAISGDILRSYLDTSFPVFVNKDYELPPFVTSDTLVFAISYSGNTEETISAYIDAQKKGCSIVVITSGGKLEALARKNNHKIVYLQTGLQPRMAYGNIFFSLLRVLQNSNFIKPMDEEVNALVSELSSERLMKKGKELASLFIDKTPIIYTSQSMFAVGNKWKINFNENTKIHAFCNVISEMNHNEIIGYTNISNKYHVIIIKFDEDLQRVKLRMDVTKDIIRNKGVDVTDILVCGKNRLQKIFFGIHLGDWVSYYLALKYGRDPTAVSTIEEMKCKMNELTLSPKDFDKPDHII